MKALRAFLRKELMEQVRSGRLLILGILFILFGIMNPAVAKLTPRLMEMLADSMTQIGMTVFPVTVTALDAWAQFFKNIPMALIAFVLLESGVFTREYQTGTLVLSLTKGLDRPKVVIAKAAVLLALWTACYWLCAGITWGYSAYYWDNSAAQHLAFSTVCWWAFGVWVLALTVLFSTVSRANTGVLAGVGGAVLLCVLLGMLPTAGKYLPTRLMDGTALIYGTAETGAYTAPLLVAAATAAACFAAGIPIFNRKQL